MILLFLKSLESKSKQGYSGKEKVASYGILWFFSFLFLKTTSQDAASAETNMTNDMS